MINWITSNRLYEDNLFYYALIIFGWFCVGFFTLGFELSGFTAQQNLFFNFVWYGLLCLGMAFAPFWYRLFFGKTTTQKRAIAIQAQIDAITDETEKQAILDYMQNDGQLPMRSAQRLALVFLGGYYLFEIFFILAWTKEHTLVWQPDWVLTIIEWIRSHINLPPIHVDLKLFLLDIHSSIDKLLHTMYATETEFLNSEFGKATLLFHFFRAFGFFPILFSFYLLFSQFISYNGMNKLKTIKISLWQQLKNFLWLSFLTFFMLLMTYAAFGKLFQDIKYSAENLFNIVIWVNHFYLNVGFLFIIIFFFLLISWFIVVKSLILTILNLNKEISL